MTTPPSRGNDEPSSEPPSEPAADPGTESARRPEPEPRTPSSESPVSPDPGSASPESTEGPESESGSGPTGRSRSSDDLPSYPATPHRELSRENQPPAGIEYPRARDYPPFDSSASPGYPIHHPGGSSEPSRDPLIPADFAGWFSRIFEVARRSFPQLAVLATIPAAISLIQQLVIISKLPSQSEIERIVAQQGPSPNPLALFETLLGNMLPIVITFSVLSAIAGAWTQAASMSVAIRNSNGQRITVGEALRSAIRRVPAVIGWSVVAGLAIMIGFMLVAPGATVGNGALAALGVVIAIALGAYLAVTFFGSLLGVIVVERQGIARCFTLIRDRWWATFGRLAAIGVLATAYVLVLTAATSVLSAVTTSDGALTGAPSNLSSGTVIIAVVEAVLMIPVMIVFVGVFTVTYAELRFHENKAATTAVLAAELDTH